MKQTGFILLVLISGFIFWGCAAKSPVKKECIPDWYLEPPLAEDAIYDAGDAAKLSLSLAKDAADQRARAAIANAIETKVEIMFRDFMQESGVGEDARALEFTERVTKMVSSITLKNSKIIKRVRCEEGRQIHMYSLAVYPLQDLRDAVLQQARNEKALFNEFKAKQGFEELEKTIKSMDASTP